MDWSKAFIMLFVGTAVGCILWLSFAEEAHSFRRTLGIEDRHAEVVSAKPLPKDPLKISIKSNRDGCMVIDKAEFDGGTLWVYWRAICVDDYQRVAWKEFAPDGTIVGMGYQYIIAGQRLNISDRGEFADYNFKLDPRAVTLELEIYRR